ncbi:MAG: hypothetical protein BWY21_00339 [Parcubacteria group bacterium ADurb.Bin216]|nr:MAG: hypothetical protein BWY21_00339 [Parcubacteria group bacterium ADurb.Bin216]
MKDEKLEATPLQDTDKEWQAVRALANQAALDYCKNTEFIDHLGGGDPKATIHNLRMMAYAHGYEAAWKATKMFSKDLKVHGH